MTADLRDACWAGDAAGVAALLAGGRSPDVPLDAMGTTALMAAASVGVVQVLLEAGASVTPTRYGHDALQVLVSGDESMIDDVGSRLVAARLLIDHGAPLEYRNVHGWSRLYVAAFGGDPAAVEALLILGANPNDDPPPLAGPCWGSGGDPVATTAMIDALVEAGADVHRRDDAGWWLLHAAAMPYSHGSGYASSDGASAAAVKALISHGVHPDLTGPGGTTALMLAAGDGELETVETLLGLGCDPDVRDDQNERAYGHCANSERRLTELLATATTETADAVRSARDRARRCVERLSDRHR